MGYSQEEWLADPDLFISSLHPDDRERVLADLLNRNAGLTGSTTMFLDYRLIARDGRVVWIRDDEIVVQDADGRPTAAQGYMQDVTERAGRTACGSSCSSASSRSRPTRRRPTRSSPSRAKSLAALFGDVEVSYVERRDEGGFWIRYTTDRGKPEFWDEVEWIGRLRRADRAEGRSSSRT